MLVKLLTAMLGFLILLNPAHAQRANNPSYELLGQKSVSFAVDRDVINIGQSEDWFRNRSYRALRFQAERSEIYMIGVRLIYINGYIEDLKINQQIRPGGGLAINLGGDRSYLKQIEMTYRSRPNFRGEAIIKVYGEQTRQLPNRAIVEETGYREILLGEKTVGFRVDRDTINVGQAEDWFKNKSFRSLRFHADGNAVHLIALRLVYLNGYIEDLRVDRRIRLGGDLRVELRGDRSYIKQIEMTYRSRPSFEGQAVVKVFGEPARRSPGQSQRRPGSF